MHCFFFFKEMNLNPSKTGKFSNLVPLDVEQIRSIKKLVTTTTFHGCERYAKGKLPKDVKVRFDGHPTPIIQQEMIKKQNPIR